MGKPTDFRGNPIINNHEVRILLTKLSCRFRGKYIYVKKMLYWHKSLEYIQLFSFR